MTEEPNFDGHKLRECGEHRTVGSHRAWCHDCTEWCYPSSPCVRCERPVLASLARAVVMDYGSECCDDLAKCGCSMARLFRFVD